VVNVSFEQYWQKKTMLNNEALELKCSALFRESDKLHREPNPSGQVIFFRQKISGHHERMEKEYDNRFMLIFTFGLPNRRHL
jgi:gluconate kinase